MQQHNTISFASAEKAAHGEVCCKTAPLVQAELHRSVAKPHFFRTLRRRRQREIFHSALALYPSQSGAFVFRQRKEVIPGSTEPTCPTGHVKDILKEWHSGQAGRPFIYPADPACRPLPHCFLFTPGAVATAERGSSKQQRVEIRGYPDVFATARLQRPGPKQALGLNSQHTCLQQTWSHSGGLFETKWKTHHIKHILNLTRSQCSVKMFQNTNTLHWFDFHGH